MMNPKKAPVLPHLHAASMFPPVRGREVAGTRHHSRQAVRLDKSSAAPRHCRCTFSAYCWYPCTPGVGCTRPMRFPRLHNVMRSMRSVAWRNVRIEFSIRGSCIQRHQTWRCYTAKGPVRCSIATTTKHHQSQGSGKWRNPSAHLSGLPGSLHTRSAYHNAQR